MEREGETTTIGWLYYMRSQRFGKSCLFDRRRRSRHNEPQQKPIPGKRLEWVEG